MVRNTTTQRLALSIFPLAAMALGSAGCSKEVDPAYLSTFETYAADACACREKLGEIERAVHADGVVSIDKAQAKEATTAAWHCAATAQGTFIGRKAPDGGSNPVIYDQSLDDASKQKVDALEAKGNACVAEIHEYLEL